MSLKTLFRSPAVRAHARVMAERKAAKGKQPRLSSDSEAGPSNATSNLKSAGDFRTARAGLLPWGSWLVAPTR